MAARKTTTKKPSKSHGKLAGAARASKLSRQRSSSKSSTSSRKKSVTRSKASKESIAKGAKKATSSKSANSASSNMKPKKTVPNGRGTRSRADTKRRSTAQGAKARGEGLSMAKTGNVSRLHANEVEAKLTVKETPLDHKPAMRGSSAVATKPRAASPQLIGAPPANATGANETERNPKTTVRDPGTPAHKPPKPLGQRQGFKLNEYVVYPAHGVGQIVAIEDQEVAGFRLELFVINFSKDKMTLRVPTAKVTGVGLRKISDPETAKRSLDILTGRARIKRTMWSRRAQEYETKINSGDIRAIAEVVRDLYRSEAQPEQSYSERQLYEAALDRMVREIAAVQKSTEMDALKTVEAQLQRGHTRNKATEPAESSSEGEIEEAA